MQGRLVPKYKKQYQSHPVGYWDQEFDVAAQLGLDLVEFIVDLDGIEENPLMSASGMARVAEVAASTGVRVSSICADCFMVAPLHSADALVARSSAAYLQRLVDHAPVLGISDIVIPCVDQSSLRSHDDTARFVAALEPLLGDADRNGVNLSVSRACSNASTLRASP
jgi:L-ribulose-5-phosphate 3-epimerase